jgi:hypothetical protein
MPTFEPPTTDLVSDRALALYAFARRGSIELALQEWEGDPGRVAQAEVARRETDRWLERESVTGLTDDERRLLDAPSGTWPESAIVDALWRRERLGICLWALEHLEVIPPPTAEFDPAYLDEAITRYGSVSSFRSNGHLRPSDQLEAAWQEADAWLGATEGRDGEDARIASTSAERVAALTWLLGRTRS